MVEKKTESVLVKMAREAIAVEDAWYGDTGTSRSVAFHSLTLSGDTGLLAGLVHKIETQQVDPNTPGVKFELAMHLTSAFHDLLVLSGLVGVDLEQALMHWRGQQNNQKALERVSREQRRNGQHR